jgi:IS30 family transposase
MKKYRRRPRLTEAEKAMLWNRWQQGDSLHAIARLLDTTHTSVRRHLVATGGIRPPQRKRSRLALTLAEREEISHCKRAGTGTFHGQPGVTS